jgi:hypothetical protein
MLKRTYIVTALVDGEVMVEEVEAWPHRVEALAEEAFRDKKPDASEIIIHSVKG